MLREYFEPENLRALAEVFEEAQSILERRDIEHPVVVDAIARRILELASQGLPPWLILAEIVPPMTPEEAGLRMHGAPAILVEESKAP